MDGHNEEHPEWLVYVIPSIHQDISFLKPPVEDMQLYVSEYLKYLDLMDADPTWCYSSEFAWAVRYFVQEHPEQKERLGRRVREGRFGITAQCSGFDPSFYTGEFIIREIGAAKDWLHRTFGYEPRGLDLADVPDFSPQLPQILTGCEIDLFLYTRAGGGRNRNGQEQHIGEFPGMWELLDNELMQVFVLYFGHDAQTGQLRALYPGYWEWKREHMHDQPISRLWNYVGLDGSQALAYAACNRYSGLYGLQLAEGVKARHWFEDEEAFFSNLNPGIDPAHTAMGVIGTDEEEINAERVVERVADWNANQAAERGITLQLSTVEQFAARMAKAVTKGDAQPGEYSGVTPGWFFARYDKDDLYVVQNRLPAAEMLASFNALLGTAPYPAQQIERAWQVLWMVSHNQIHDDEYVRAVRDSSRATEGLLSRSLSQLTSAIQPARPSPPILVFNPLNWDRHEKVRVPVPAGTALPGVIDGDGRTVPSTVVATDDPDRNEIEFIARGVPGLGYRTFYLEKGRAQASDLEVGEDWVQNRYFRAEVDQEGYLHLYDREKSSEIAGTGSATGPLRLVGQGKQGELTWQVAEKLVTRDDTKTTLSIRGWLSRSPVTLTLSLGTEMKRLDLDIDLDWDGERGVQVYLPLPFRFEPNELCTGVACGHVPYVRPTAMMNLRGAKLSRRSADASFSTFWVLPLPHNPIPGDGFGWAYMQKWGYLGKSSGGVVIASGRRNGLVVGDGVLAVPVLQVPRGRGRHTRRTRLYEKGHHHWLLSFTTVEHVEQAPRFGWEVAQPLLATCAWRQGGTLADAQSLIEVESESAIWMAFKQTYDGAGWAARFFESADRDCEVRLRMHPALHLQERDVSHANMLERAGQALSASDSTFSINVRGFEITTIRIEQPGAAG